MKRKMSYLIKFLTVEGYVNIGDRFLADAINESDEIDILIAGQHTDLHLINELKKYRKVKPFLCSKDLKIGDKVIMPSQYQPYYQEFKVVKTPESFARQYALAGVNQYVNEGNPVLLNQYTFKVLAEVSPNAIWVENDMEIKEEDAKFVLIEGDLRGREMSLSEIKCFVGNSHKNVRAHLKGPCGHFH